MSLRMTENAGVALALSNDNAKRTSWPNAHFPGKARDIFPQRASSSMKFRIVSEFEDLAREAYVKVDQSMQFCCEDFVLHGWNQHEGTRSLG